MDPVVVWLVLAAAGFGAGAINAVAGGGSLLSFPALLAVGYPPIQANVTNTVAAVPGYIGGAWGYRSELSGQRQRSIRLGITGMLGALAGASLLLIGTDEIFSAVVPWLVLGSTLLLAVQPWLTRDRAESRGPTWGLDVGNFLVGVYGGYFNAGLGIMMLAVLNMFILEDLQRVNALKSVLSVVVGMVAAIFFAILAPVAWGAVLVMALASLLGGWAGVRIARRVSSKVLRWVVVIYGIIVAVVLWVQH